MSAETQAGDGAAFAADQRRWAAAVGADADLRRHARHVLETADRHGWTYLWRWMGLPVIQSPEDIVTMQEIIWQGQPDLVIETGVARGGSVVLYASILELLGEGHVLGIDVDVREHNRAAIASHPLAHRITLLEGSSVDPDVVARVTAIAAEHERVMVVLDSDHTHAHVLAELRAYADLVSPGQLLVVADTVVEELPRQTHRPRPWGPGDNPATAMAAFLAETADFVPDPYYNDRLLLTSSPGGYLRRVR